MVIRHYKASDRNALAQLFYDTVHEINKRDYTREQLDAWATGRVDLEKWNQSFLKHETLVAETDHKIVSFADMDISVGYLDRLFVHKHYQGNKIASSLLHRLEEYAIKAGITSFKTYASITAKSFFEKQGYIVDSENTVLRNGIKLINYKMTKHI